MKTASRKNPVLFWILLPCLLAGIYGVVHARDETPAMPSAQASESGFPDRHGAEMAVDERVRSALKHLNPELVPDYVGPAPVPGYQEVVVKGQSLFVSNDGLVLAQGLIDIRQKRDVSQFGVLPGRRLKALDEIPASERIVFAPSGDVKYTVQVFTDVACGFCRKLHEDIAEYNRLGIAVEYLAFPRTGIDSQDAIKMAAVWCSKDRKKALTDAKMGVEVHAPECDNPVAKHHEIGTRIGLKGTPLFINADGIAIPSYLPPDKLLETLDRLAAQQKPQH